MKHVSILVPETAVIEAVADPRYMFSAVNMFLQEAGKEALFNVQLVGLRKEVKLEGSIFSVHTDMLPEEVSQTDLIVIPALSGDMTAAIE
ncbi:MAG TPA: AraC family transcriptional regulator, partial [Chitinophagaceae bacterium]|nr:AraC family transcriptional regulator [Chitinophagaceae bacterium]